MLAAHTKRMIAAAAAGVLPFTAAVDIQLFLAARAGVDSHRAFRRHGFNASKNRSARHQMITPWKHFF